MESARNTIHFPAFRLGCTNFAEYFARNTRLSTYPCALPGMSPSPVIADASPAWSPASWRERPAAQQPTYPDPAALSEALTQLRALPPLVTSWEIQALRQQIAEATRGQRFILQGGECAEHFNESSAGIIANRLKVLLQMSLVLIFGIRTPVVRIGRFAGQHAKPRSSDSESRNGRTLPSYRGDLVNDAAFTPEARKPDPKRLMQAHAHSAMTLNLVRALTNTGFADLHHPEYWNLDFIHRTPLEKEYRQIVESIQETIAFIETVSGNPLRNIERTRFFTSHEALHLPYEETFTRHVPHNEGTFNLGTHFPWIGARTSDPEGAHIEYARGIANPVGLKIAPHMAPKDLVRIIRILNPRKDPGRLVLIHRLGAGPIADLLPPLIRAVQDSGIPVAWMSDPMHGNTELTDAGIKTRRFENILDELEQAFDIHVAEGSHLGGVHFELAGEDVTECTGGASGLNDTDLARAYKSQVDPRLNYEQALEMAFLIVRKKKRMENESAL